jgi:hypothetical protein
MGNQTTIHNAPDGNQDHVKHLDFYAADEFYDGIAVRSLPGFHSHRERYVLEFCSLTR